MGKDILTFFCLIGLIICIFIVLAFIETYEIINETKMKKGLPVTSSEGLQYACTPTAKTVEILELEKKLKELKK